MKKNLFLTDIHIRLDFGKVKSFIPLIYKY